MLWPVVGSLSRVSKHVCCIPQEKFCRLTMWNNITTDNKQPKGTKAMMKEKEEKNTAAYRAKRNLMQRKKGVVRAAKSRKMKRRTKRVRKRREKMKEMIAGHGGAHL